MSNVMSAQPAPALGQSLLPQVGQPGGWQAWVSQPANRAALVQAGIALLQPLGVGQSVGGQIGSAIGSGLEARDRVVTGQQEAAARQVEQSIAQQEADARTKAADAAMLNAERTAAGGGLTTYQALMMDERRKNGFIKWAQKRAEDPFNPVDLQDPETVNRLADEYNALLAGSAAVGGGPTPVPGAPGATLSEALPSPTTPPVAAPGADPYPEGTVIVNQQTQQRMVRRNGQWVAM